MSKILIIDDAIELNQLIQTRLEADRHKVITAYDGKEGLEKVESEKPDLIVLDVNMPEMDGFEVCRTLKSDDRYSKIPIIFLSAMAEQSDFKAGIETGADAYIVKPYEPTILLAKIESLLKNKKDEQNSKK